MPRYRFRDDSSTGSTIATVLLGAVAGFAVGMYVAQRVGGLSGLKSRLKKARPGDGSLPERQFDFAGDEFDEVEGEGDLAEREALSAEEDEDFNGMDAVEGEDDGVPLLEERVLEAFNNDPVLAERAIDIGSVGTGIIELAGWVDSDDEAEKAMTLARGVPGVQTVVNRLMVDDEEQQIGENVRRFNAGDPALTEARWEGQQVGTGKRRQGTSDEVDRHADPKPGLEDRWLSEREALKNAAEEIPSRKGKQRRNAEETQPEA
jgi:osmotically-inducible protein OsmY